MLPFSIEGWQIQAEEILPQHIVDIRPEEGFRRARLEGALSLPYTDCQDRAEATLPRGESVLVVDAGGARAAEMALWLRARGYDAGFLKGGMAAWSGDLES